MTDDSDRQEIKAFLLRVAEIMGGQEEFMAAMVAERRATREKWNKDVLTIGRILRAHLYVEHYLTEYIQHLNPALGDIDGARITFNQKVRLLQSGDTLVSDIIPGIRHLNSIRNRLAHNLEAKVTDEDARVFLQGTFKALRNKGVLPSDDPQSESPIDVLEDFAQYASKILHGPKDPVLAAMEGAMIERAGLRH
ncbi:hypothetical protein [Paraburkholderia terrae]|uniref:hypothetical protein n=1 Tax=Paraburkholderia terrae TaxID=311230 RepID=UPI001EE2EF35|nr:hypothetical protein [Paraburkholderia terrae]GJH04503.1 hypothetical protein CBA19C8_28120 [Paraburkholderia terrae]